MFFRSSYGRKRENLPIFTGFRLRPSARPPVRPEDPGGPFRASSLVGCSEIRPNFDRTSIESFENIGVIFGTFWADLSSGVSTSGSGGKFCSTTRWSMLRWVVFEAGTCTVQGIIPNTRTGGRAATARPQPSHRGKALRGILRRAPQKNRNIIKQQDPHWILRRAP